EVRVAIRHCTLVPGWLALDHCKLPQGGLPSLELEHIRGRVTIDSCITGAILTAARHAGGQPRIELRDSIVDALADDGLAVFATQRRGNLRQRLDEYTTSRMDTGIFYAD